jgi:hypothetical protein
MAQRRDRARFTLETLLQLNVLREMLGQNLKGNSAVEPGVASAVNLAHATGPKRRLDFVRTEFRAGG